MKNYLINNLEIEDVYIITLLDYELRVSEVLKSIKLPSFDSRKVLIDTALCAGINKYRFIEAKLNNDGTIDLNDYKYVNVSSRILEKANDIIRHEPIKLENSILTIPQINYIKVERLH